MKFRWNVLQRAYDLFSHPEALIIQLNSECNYDCIYCYSKRGDSKKNLSADEWRNIIDDARAIGFSSIHFSGGEPLLYPEFYSLVKYALKKIPRAVIFTNGSLITEEWVKKLKGLNVVIAIKFDSPATYGKHTRRPEFYQKMIDAIKMCAEHGIPVVSFITLTKYNAEHIEEMMSKALELGTYPVVERFIPTGKMEKDLETDIEAWEKVLNSMNDVYSEIIDLYEDLNYSKKSLCGCYRDVVSITSGGDVLPCPGSPSNLSLGNVREKSLKEMWNEYKKKREEWLRIPEECKNCRSAPSCGGGCKTYSFIKFGTFNKKDPLCKGRGHMPPTICHMGFLACNQRREIKR